MSKRLKIGLAAAPLGISIVLSCLSWSAAGGMNLALGLIFGGVAATGLLMVLTVESQREDQLAQPGCLVAFYIVVNLVFFVYVLVVLSAGAVM